jgi:hypothetical protein
LEKILFRNKVLWLFDERTSASWAREIYLGEEKLDHINKQIQELIDSSISVPNLIQSMNNLFTYERGSKGFHRWGGLKYFLFEYEDELKVQYKEDNNKVSIDHFDSTTIEHIIPQQFSDNWSDIVNNFSDGIEKDKMDMAHKVFINTLGNLTILKDGKNSSLGNGGWLAKRNRFTTGSYNEIEISKNDNWSKKEILERGLKMIGFLETKIQGLKFSDDEKLKFLFYEDFIITKITGSQI